MRTQTIYNAMTGAHRTILFTQTVDVFLRRKARQWAKFELELLRRMAGRDTLAERNAFLLASAEAAQANLAACRRELAEARATISANNKLLHDAGADFDRMMRERDEARAEVERQNGTIKSEAWQMAQMGRKVKHE